MAGKKLVMIVYFAPWCGNWRNEAPIAAKLYEKYKAQGFQVIGVSEYATRDDVHNFFGKDGPPYPVVTESESREDKQKTAHYRIPAAHRRQTKLGFAMEHLSRARRSSLLKATCSLKRRGLLTAN